MKLEISRRLKSVGDRLPRPTVRRRLAMLYSSIFLVLGASLLTITTLLWGSSTDRQHGNFETLVPKIVQHFAAPPGQLRNLVQLPGILGEVLPFRSPAWIAMQIPIGSRAARGLLRSISPGQNVILSQQKYVGVQLRIVATQQHSIDLHQLLWYSGLALAIMTMIAILAGWLMAGRVLRPLHTITTTARDISATNLHERLRMAGPGDELKELGDTFDNLLDRLEGSFRAQRQFVANAAHELRTPLATMRAEIDVATNKPDAVPDATTNLADRLRDDLDQIDRLLESFLTLARAQRGPLSEGSEVALDDVVRGSVERHRDAIANMAIDIDLDAFHEISVQGNAVLLTRMVDNLIGNAIKHNVQRGWLHLHADTEGAMARLVVENGGPVLNEGSVTDFAQPFRRAGADRTGIENGSGLGLSIVAAIVEAHSGQLELHALPGGGLQAIVHLPLTASIDSDAT